MPSEAERITRKQRIDPRLARADWAVAPFRAEDDLSSFHKKAVEEYETANGPADYALCDKGRVQAVVEAKKVTLGPQGVLTQAERYSKGIGQVPRYQGEFGVPFLYSTNGEVMWFHDVRHKLSRLRRVAGFHTPAALEEMLTRDGTEGSVSSAGQQGISGLTVKSQPLALPSLREQAEIVHRVSKLLGASHGTLTRIDTASRHIDRSSQAVLAKAFKGELVRVSMPDTTDLVS
jgi:hypothetical protein